MADRRDMRSGGEALEVEIAGFLKSWADASVAGDAEAAAGLRTKDYRSIWPDGRSLTSAQEVAAIAASDVRPTKISTQIGKITEARRETCVSFTLELSAEGH